MRIGPFDLTFTRSSSPRRRVREFGGQGASIEYLSDLIIQLEALQGNATSRYLHRREQVGETIRKYKGQAAKGNKLLRNILETRSAFTVGRGLSVTGWLDGSPEKQFVDAFRRRNRFNLAYLRSLGRERCFEGQVLLVLLAQSDGIPALRFVSWYDTGYEVTASPLDYATIERIRWEGRGRDFSIAPGQAAFMRFHSRLNSVEGTPLFAGVLETLEDLDDALTLMRSINTAAANPTPYFQFEQEADASAFRDYLKTSGWKMGQALAGNSTAQMLQIGYGPYTSIENHVVMLAKVISGHTSVPLHYFGFPDLLNNRSVADDINRMYVVLSETEVDQWAHGFTDLIGRAMAMYNEATGSKLDTQAGQVEVEQISQEQFTQAVQVWLPLWLGGGITTETLLSKLPGIDEQVEAVAVQAELKERQGLTPGQLVPNEERGEAFKTYRAFSSGAM